LDFTSPRQLTDAMRTGRDPQIRIASGLVHNFVVKRKKGSNDLVEAARLEHPDSCRVMTVLTTMPGIQVHPSNAQAAAGAGYSGRLYRQTDAICFETQNFPDAPNHREFPSAVLRPDEEFTSTTIYRFSNASSNDDPDVTASDAKKASPKRKSSKGA